MSGVRRPLSNSKRTCGESSTRETEVERPAGDSREGGRHGKNA